MPIYATLSVLMSGEKNSVYPKEIVALELERDQRRDLVSSAERRYNTVGTGNTYWGKSPNTDRRLARLRSTIANKHIPRRKQKLAESSQKLVDAKAAWYPTALQEYEDTVTTLRSMAEHVPDEILLQREHEYAILLDLPVTDPDLAVGLTSFISEPAGVSPSPEPSTPALGIAASEDVIPPVETLPVVPSVQPENEHSPLPLFESLDADNLRWRITFTDGTTKVCTFTPESFKHNFFLELLNRANQEISSPQLREIVAELGSHTPAPVSWGNLKGDLENNPRHPDIMQSRREGKVAFYTFRAQTPQTNIQTAEPPSPDSSPDTHAVPQEPTFFDNLDSQPPVAAEQDTSLANGTEQQNMFMTAEEHLSFCTIIRLTANNRAGIPVSGALLEHCNAVLADESITLSEPLSTIRLRTMHKLLDTLTDSESLRHLLSEPGNPSQELVGWFADAFIKNPDTLFSLFISGVDKQKLNSVFTDINRKRRLIDGNAVREVMCPTSTTDIPVPSTPEDLSVERGSQTTTLYTPETPLPEGQIATVTTPVPASPRTDVLRAPLFAPGYSPARSEAEEEPPLDPRELVEQRIQQEIDLVRSKTTLTEFSVGQVKRIFNVDVKMIQRKYGKRKNEFTLEEALLLKISRYHWYRHLDAKVQDLIPNMVSAALELATEEN